MEENPDKRQNGHKITVGRSRSSAPNQGVERRSAEF